MSSYYRQVYFSKTLVDCSILLFYACFTHGLLLLNDGVYWDDWILYIDLLRENWASLYEFDRELGGLPVGYWLTLVLGHLPNTVLFFKCLFFCSILFSGVFVYLICHELGFHNRPAQLFISLVVISYPAFQMTVSIATGTYWVWYCCFLSACYVTVKGLNTQTPLRYYLRFLSYILFGLAFRTSSFLVFYFGFFFLLLLYDQGGIQSFNLLRMLYRSITEYLDYFCYPFFYFFIIKLLFPPSGLYADYNALTTTFSLSTYLDCYVYFFKNGVFIQLKDGIRLLIRHFMISIPLIAALFVIFSFNMPKPTHSSGRHISNTSLLLFGVFIFCLAAFPYAMVMKYPSPNGVDTRHSLLVGLPVGIVLFGIVFGQSTRFRNARVFVLCALLSLMSLSCIRNYLFWQVHWIKDRSTIYHLAQTIQDDVSIIWVDDSFLIPETEPHHQYYAYSSMFRYVWDVDSIVGFDNKSEAFYRSWMLTEGLQFFPVERYNLTGFQPGGREKVLTIHEGPLVEQYGFLGLSLRYWYYNYLRDDDMGDFLSGVTTVEMSDA